MNILNKYVFKSLLLNKTRTIVTIIGIMLSCALITALACLITSFHQTVIDMAIDDYGNRHVTFLDVSPDDIDLIIYNKNVEYYYITGDLGYSILENSVNENKPYLNILAYDDDSLEALESSLISGRLPENEYELVISNHIIYDGLVNYEIGDTITLDIGQRLSDGYELTQSNPYYEDSTEKLVINETVTYTIVGIIERQNIEDYSAPGYTVITKLNELTDSLNVSVLYYNVSDYETITQSILKINDITSNYGVTYNTSLIKAQGAGFSDSSMRVFYSIGAILSVIIVATSTICIRNSFAISTTEKTKNYGMFASIGATPKQIKKLVLFEGVILGTIGVTLGVLLGIIASYILILLINFLLDSSISSLMVFNVSIYGILISVLLSILTIYLSCIGSAKKASKTSEIETIKLTNEIKNKKIKDNKIITKLFGVTGNVSYKNMLRNKSKFRVTVISITVCILTFITMSTFIDLGFKSLNETYRSVEFNLIVDNFTDYDNTELYSSIAEDIINLNDINKYAYHRSMHLDEISLENTSTYTVAVGEEEYLRYITELGYTYYEVKDKALVYNQYIMDNETGKYTDEKFFDDDILNLTFKNFVESSTSSVNIDVIMIESLPMGFELTFMDAPIIIVSDETFDNIYDDLKTTVYESDITYYYEEKLFVDHELFIYSDNITELNKTINEYKETNLYSFSITDLEETVSQMNNIIILVSILLYGFIGVITLIGITNIFNTITTSMNLRRREFAIMQSIGTSKKELNKMIFFESILYGLKSLMCGLPLGIIGSYLIFKATENSSSMSDIINGYTFPYSSILISSIFTFIIIIIIMKVSLSKINKQNIIETIRNENI